MIVLDRLLYVRRRKSALHGFATVIVSGCVVAGALAATVGTATAGGHRLSVLYSFCQQQNCADGAQPDGPLVADSAGNLYGTTGSGGSTNCFDGCGTVFRLAPDGTETVLYAFCSKDASCPDGEYPESPLILDSSDNLYGTTPNVSANGGGTVFKLAPGGTETVLYRFCSRSGCADGDGPNGGLVMDRRGNLYGTTATGGTSCTQSGCGTVFKLRPDGKEKVLYSFCSQDSCADGLYPNGGLVMDRDGNLYGTASEGGANSYNCAYLFGYNACGVVFKVSPTGVETVLYSFCASANCADGAWPAAGVVLDKNGNLYGTARAGGNLNQYCPSGPNEIGSCGVVFEVKPDSTETVLYAFCAQANCADGDFPLGGVTLKYNKSGITLYGTAEFGGANQGNFGAGAGVVYSLSSGTENVLHSFCSRANCADGEYPQSGVIMDGGSLVGAAWAAANTAGAPSTSLPDNRHSAIARARDSNDSPGSPENYRRRRFSMFWGNAGSWGNAAEAPAPGPSATSSCFRPARCASPVQSGNSSNEEQIFGTTNTVPLS
jgi:uncharacterized repeat protein (TIGR03803 family)